MLRGLWWLMALAPIAQPCSCGYRESLCKTLAQPDAKLRSHSRVPVFLGRVLDSYPSSWNDFLKLQWEFANANPGMRAPNGWPLTFEGAKRFLLELWGDKASPTLRRNILAVPEEKRPGFANPLSSFQALSHVEVVEPFGGVQKGTVLEFVGGLGEADCSVRFEPGEHYLVFAIQDEYGFWTTSSCYGSTAARGARAELRALRAVRDGRPFPPFLFGTVVDTTNRGARDPWKELPEFPLRVTGEGIAREVVTDADGMFFVDDLPAGSYRLDLVTPGWALNAGDSLPFRITSGCTDASLAVAQVQSTVSGRIEPTKGQVFAKLPVHLLPTHPGAPGRSPWGTTDSTGGFRIKYVEPSEYYLAVNPRGIPRPTGPDDSMPAIPYPASYYPGRPTKDDALPVRVERGKDVSLPSVWILPPPLVESDVEVQVRKATGEPFPDARVIVRDVEGDIVVNRAGPTPRNGMVPINVIKGRRYRIEAGAVGTDRRPVFYSALDLAPEDPSPLVLTLIEGRAPPNSYLFLFANPAWTAAGTSR